MTFDILIRNGNVIDGVAGKAYSADIGISGGIIKAVGNLRGSSAGQIIAADGLYVAPGFIDPQNHSDSYMTLLEIPTMDSLVTQGITTIVIGHCGTSLAPLASPEALKSIQKWHSLAGANINWQTYAEYAESLRRYPLGTNVMGLVGHATVRRGLIGDQIRTATVEEILMIEKMLSDSFDAGAMGVSFGLVYAHEVNSSKQELISVAKMVAGREKILSVHLRSEGSGVVQALEEVIEIAQESGAALKISHFKIRGQKNHEHLEEALAVIDRAYQRGVNVFFDVYPYTTSWTVLYTYLPKWAYEGGKSAILKNIKDKSSRQKILSFLASGESALGSIFIATSETNPGLTGKTLAQIAANQEVSVEEALLNVLEATATHAIVFDRNISDESMTALLKHPLAIIGTDGAGYDFSYSAMHGLVHPRCFGTMPRFLSLVREKKIMSWEEAVKKMTSRTADKMGIKNRGRIAAGQAADVVVFDPHSIGSRATYENPYQQADGISYVIVNGRVSFAYRESAIGVATGLILRS